MALTLKQAPARQGLAWVREGFATFARKPMAFTGLFSMFLAFQVLLAFGLGPLLGPLSALLALPLAFTLPLLSMAFMVATRSALQGGAVLPTHFVEALGTDPLRRRRMLTLCGAYAVACLVIFGLGEWIDAGRPTPAPPPEVTDPEVAAALARMQFGPGATLSMALAVLLSVPYWHAPALVLWGGQGVGQALFSSTLAVWRNRGAFVAYTSGWIALTLMFAVASAVVMALVGAAAGVAGVVAVGLGGWLVFSTAFYVSLLFTFNDSFGAGGALAMGIEAPADTPTPPTA
jgi:hypothetical protein